MGLRTNLGLAAYMHDDACRRMIGVKWFLLDFGGKEEIGEGQVYGSMAIRAC